jgi:putative DNA primase/helicase
MLQGKLIVEFAEMAGFSARDIKAVQAWITLQEDEVEVKNKQMTAVHKRQFILAGTYNPVQGNGWLANIPGMRRFVPFTVKSPIDIKGLREVREQLWAEAAHLEADGYPIIIGSDNPLHKFAQDERKTRSVIDVWEEMIEEFIEERTWWRTADIMKKMGFTEARYINTLEHRRVCATLEKKGWVYKKIRANKWQSAWVENTYIDLGGLEAQVAVTEEIKF